MNKVQKYSSNSSDSNRILYTSSSFAHLNLFYLQEIGSLTATKPHSSHRDYLNSFLFLYVEKGSGTIDYRGNRFVLNKGDAAFVDCRFPYTHSTSNNSWALRWIHLNGQALPNIFSKFIERSGNIQFHINDASRVIDIFSQIETVSMSESYVRDMEIHQLLSSLLTILMRDCWNTELRHSSCQINTGIESLYHYLIENFQEKLSLDHLSERFFVSKFHMTKLFKEKYGVTIHDFLLEIRISHAKELIRFSSLSLDQIASNCGFYDLPHFSRQFKKAEGITPSAYRNQWK